MTTLAIVLTALDEDTDPWEQQPGETVYRFNQFARYRDMGRARTLRRVAETLNRSPAYVGQVCAAYMWVERAASWDRNRDHLHEQVWLDERRIAAQADAQLLRKSAAVLTQRMASLKAEELEPADLIRLLDVTMRHHRNLFGQEVTVAVTGPAGGPVQVALADLADLSPEQRRQQLNALAADVIRRSESAAGTADDE